MAEFNALNLILSAEYIGGGAIKAMSNDIKGMVSETSGLSRLGAGFSALGNVMLAAGTAMAIGMAASVKVAMEYDDAVNRIIAVGGIHVGTVLSAKDAHDSFTASLIANRNELQAFNAEVASSAAKFGLKPTDIAKGSYFLYSALPAMNITGPQALGYNVIQQLAAYTRASGPADQGGVSFGQAAQDIPRLMASYNTPISGWGGAMGQLTFLENSAHLTQAQLVQAMTKFLPAAGVLGMGFGDSATLMAALSTTGVFGSRAGTEASSALFHMFSGTPSALKGLSAFGLDPSKLFGKDGKLMAPDQLMFNLAGQLSKMPRDQALNAERNLFAMVGNRAFGPLFASGMDKYQALLTKEKSLGIDKGGRQSELYMMAVAGSMMDSPKAKFQSMLAAFELLGITVGNKLMPFVLRAVDGLTNLALALTGIINNSHSVGDFFKNILATLFGGKGGSAGGASGIGAIGAGLMNMGGGGALLGLLGTLLGGGIASKGLGKGLGLLGAVDSTLIGSKGKGIGAYALDMLFGTKPEMGPHQMLFGGREGGLLSGLFGPGRSLGMKFDNLVPQAHQFKGIDWAKLFPAMDHYERSQHMRGVLKLPTDGPSKHLLTSLFGFGMDAGHLVTGASGKLASGAGGLAMNVAGGLGGALGHIKGGGLANDFAALGGHAAKLPATLAHLGTTMSGHVAGGFGKVASGAKNAGGALLDFGSRGVLGAAKGIGGLVTSLPRLATGGFGLLRQGIVSFIPMLLGIGSAALPIIVILLLLAGAVAIGVLIFTKFRTQTMAALQPLFKEMSSVFNSIKQMIGGAIQQITATWNRMWPQIKPAMEQFLGAVKQMGPVWTIVGGTIKLVVAIILGVIVGLVNGFLHALPFIIRVFTGIVQVITGVSKIIVDIFHGQWGKIPGDIMLVVNGIWKIVSGGFMMVLTFVGGFVMGILNWFNKLTHGALQGIIDWVHGLINWFTHLWNQLVGHSIIPDMINAIINWFKKLPSQILTLIVSFVLMLIDRFNQMKTRVTAAVQLLVETAKQKFVDLVANILKVVGDLPNKLGTMGHDMMMGLVNGIKNNAGAVADAVKNAVGDAITGAKHLLGIKSPSTVFHHFGNMSMEGFAQGFKSNTSAHEAVKALLPGGKLQLGGSGKLSINSLHVDNLHLPKDAFPQQQPQAAQRSPAQEYLFARNIQQSREQSTGLYDRRSSLDQSYRYAAQYSQ